MFKILLDEKSLIKRGPKLSAILKPLRDNSNPIPWKRLSKTESEIIFSVQEKEIISNYRDWRINTFHKNFKANYFERWIGDNGNKWCLERCYLNIYHLNKSKGEETEYICLHADPLENKYEHLEFKQAFHLHIIKADQPIPHSHLAFGHQFLNEIYRSEDTFFFHFKKNLQLIVKEILERVPQIGT